MSPNLPPDSQPSSTAPSPYVGPGPYTNTALCPYVGARPYTESDSAFFFGRRRDAALLRNKILAMPLTVLVAPSGVGKTSVLRALVIPALRDLKLHVAYFDKWVATPVAALRAKLARSLGAETTGEEGRSLLDLVRIANEQHHSVAIVIDQLEQGFIRHAGEMDAFGAEIGEMLRSDANVHVVFSIREEYLAGLESLRAHLLTVNQATHRLGRLTGDAAREAIREPVHTSPFAGSVEPALVEALLGDLQVSGERAGVVETSAGSEGIDLPFLQIVCKRLWEAAGSGNDRQLTSELYEKLGRRKGIVDRYVQEAMAELIAEQRLDAAKTLDLLAPLDGAKVALTVAMLEKLVKLGHERLDAVLSHLGDKSILRKRDNGKMVELWHDAYTQVLRPWIDKALQAEKDAEEQAERDELARKAKEELDRERARRRRTAWVAVVAALAAVAMLGLAIWAFQARRAEETAKTEAVVAFQDANRARDEAERAKEEANVAAVQARLTQISEGLARRDADWNRYRAVLEKDAARAATALAERNASDAEAASKRAMTEADRAKDGALLLGAQKLLSQQHVPAAAALLLEVKDPSGTKMWANTAIDVFARPVASSHQVDMAVRLARWSPDGGRILTSDGEHIWIWSADDLGLVSGPRRIDRLSSSALSADGSRLLVVTKDGSAQVWRLPSAAAGEDERPSRTRDRARARENAERLVRPEESKLVDIEPTGDPVLCLALQTVETVAPPTGPVPNADGSGSTAEGTGSSRSQTAPRNEAVVAVSKSGTIRRWGASGGLPEILLQRKDDIKTAACSADGTHVLTVDANRIPRLWTSTRPNEDEAFNALPEPVASVTWSADRQRIFTFSSKGTVQILFADKSRAPLVMPRDPDAHRAAMSADGKTIAVGHDDGTVVVRKVEGFAVRFVFRASRTGLLSLELSPDGEQVLTVSEEELAQAWSIGYHSVLHGHGGAVKFASFSPDRARVVTASADRTARIWKADGSEEPLILRGHGGTVSSAMFSADGKLVVTASADKTARVWRTDGSGESLVYPHDHPLQMAFFDSRVRHVVTFGPDLTRVWDTDGSGSFRELHESDDHGLLELLWATVQGMSRVSPDLTRVVEFASPDTLVVRNLDGPINARYLEGPGGKILFAAFSPDGTRIVAASESGRVRIQDAGVTGVALDFRAHESKVHAATFSADGQYVVTASEDGTARVWPVTIPALQRALATRPVECPTAEIRQRYLGESEEKARSEEQRCLSSR